MIKKKIVITGGHPSPALASIRELQKRGNWIIYFFGRQRETEGENALSLEAQIIPEMGVNFIPINAGKLQRKFTRWTIPALIRLPFGFFQALYYLIKIRPNSILSFGGYVSVPVVLAGWILRIPSITHEQTTVVGLGTKINQIFASKIAISWPDLSWRFPHNKTVFTGNPVNTDALKTDEKLWQLLNFDNNKPLILITGGRQGSHSINEAVEKILDQLLKNYNVFHQVGPLARTGDFERLEKKRSKLPKKLQTRYHLKKNLIGLEWGTILGKADLVISRAGINTLTELAILGKPMILIPFPWLHNNEQNNNALMFKKWGLARVIQQNKLSAELLKEAIDSMFADLDCYQKAGIKIKKLVKKDAAQKIIDEVEKIS